MRPPEPGRIALSCAREKPHRNVGEKNQDARLEGKTVGSERALIERRLLMRLVQDEEEHEERVGDALARVVAALRRGRGFGLREAQEPEKLCWIAAEIVQPGEERALGAQDFVHEAPCPRVREDEPCGDDDDEREARDEVDGDVEAFRAYACACGGSERNA